jgi:hypothetical protein
MSSDERRMALLHEIQAWREALDASGPGSARHRKFRNKMKLAEWELRALGPSQGSPGVDIKIVTADKEPG